MSASYVLTVSGSRSLDDPLEVLTVFRNYLRKHGRPQLVIHGGAYGVDTIIAEYCQRYLIATKKVKPEWDKLGRSAGFVRNQEMALQADKVLAIWDGASRGTKGMIDYCSREQIPCTVVELRTAEADRNYKWDQQEGWGK